MAERSYIFVRTSDRAKLAAAAEKLAHLSGLVGWDATDGHFQAAMLCEGEDSGCRENLQAIDKAAELLECRLADNTQASAFETSLDEDKCYSYVLIDAEREKVTSVTESLQAMDGIVSVVPTHGPFNVVAVVSGPTFDTVDRIVNEHIYPLDGLLRYKQDRIIQRNLRRDETGLV
ncbi:hypothetical protein GF377_00405 [candidate division GN15 bacterium]|nr:hypothetical protein [candidate division GN15 bacterium]